MDPAVWHPGVCALCLETTIVAPFVAFPDEEDAPYFYACGNCYLGILSEEQRLAS